MIIKPPYIITPRLLPGYRCGDWIFSVDFDRNGSPLIYADNLLTHQELICSDIRRPPGRRIDYREALETFASFLSAWHEARRYPQSDNKDLFGEEWEKCADDCSEELSMLEIREE